MENESIAAGISNAKYTKEKYDQQANSFGYQLNLLLRSWYYKHYCLKDLKTSLLETLQRTTAWGDLIDIGGGTGEKSKYLWELVDTQYRFIFTDISENMIEQAKINLAKNSKTTAISFQCVNLISDPERHFFDISDHIGGIVCNQVLHHYSEEERRAFYEKAYANLTSGGFLAITSCYTPEQSDTLVSQISQAVFELITTTYTTALGRTDYNFTTFSKTVKAMQEVGFTIDQDYSKQYKMAGISGLYNQIIGYRL